MGEAAGCGRRVNRHRAKVPLPRSISVHRAGDIRLAVTAHASSGCIPHLHVQTSFQFADANVTKGGSSTVLPVGSGEPSPTELLLPRSISFSGRNLAPSDDLRRPLAAGVSGHCGQGVTGCLQGGDNRRERRDGLFPIGAAAVMQQDDRTG